jgi:hypothetical protein
MPDTPDFSEAFDMDARSCPICRTSFRQENVKPAPRNFKNILDCFEVQNNIHFSFNKLYLFL